MATQLNFFNTVSTFAKPFVKANAKAASKDPLLVAKLRFAQVADEQVKLINDDKPKGFWFTKHGTGFVLTLKSGAATLNADQPSFAVGNAKDAVKFLEQAKAAAAAGEFDALFKATARAPRKPKSEAAAPATPAAAPAPAAPVAAPASAQKKRK